MEEVVLVDDSDRDIGVMEKMEAHRKGELHRAFSVFLFNPAGECLIQKRSTEKYHSPGLWTNACCSHPKPDETVEEATKRRLREELGISCELTFVYKFKYKVQLTDTLTEHEIDYVYAGICETLPSINPEEVAEWKFVQLDEVRKDIAIHPTQYTHWFKLILGDEKSHLLFLRVVSSK